MSIKVPKVLSFQRGTIVSDGTLSSIVPTEKGEELVPIKVVRHGIRGINNKPKPNSDGVANIQRTESAKTAADAVGLAVEFAYRTLSADQLLFGCSDPAYRLAVNGFVERFFVRGIPEFDEVCLRYARNILNGRWLWRNLMLGEASVSATVKSNGKVYSGAGSRRSDFDQYTDDEKALAQDVIATGLLSGQGGAPTLSVVGRVTFGFKGEVEVFPSQNMVTNKPKGFARSLYKVDMISRKELISILSGANKDGEDAGEFMADMIDMGRAALRDQKIGNAIRTIDTWYPGYSGTPLPIEPNGASLETNLLHRKETVVNAEGLLSKIDEIVPSATFNPNAAYLIALIVRGGVFSEKA